MRCVSIHREIERVVNGFEVLSSEPGIEFLESNFPEELRRLREMVKRFATEGNGAGDGQRHVDPMMPGASVELVR